jgi:hypothetical protein
MPFQHCVQLQDEGEPVTLAAGMAVTVGIRIAGRRVIELVPAPATRYKLEATTENL